MGFGAYESTLLIGLENKLTRRIKQRKEVIGPPPANVIFEMAGVFMPRPNKKKLLRIVLHQLNRVSGAFPLALILPIRYVGGWVGDDQC